MGLTRIRAEQISDIDYKQAVRVVTVGNIALSGGAPAMVDGVSLTIGNRILVTGNTDRTTNGIYTVEILGSGNNGTWVRSTDANQDGEIAAGLVIMVTEGSQYSDTQWKLITDDPIVLGTTELEFVSVLGSGEFGIQTLSYNGDGSTTTFSVSSGQTTDTVLAFLNGVAQTPIVDYTVSGTSIIFDEAPGTDVAIILKEFTSSQSALLGNVLIGTSSNNTVTINSEIVSNLIPGQDIAYDIGSSDKKWKDLYLSGNTIVLGNISGAAVTTTGSVSAAGVVATGNVSGGNIVSTALMSAATILVTGNISGSNLSITGTSVANQIRSLTALDQPYQMVVRTSGYTVPSGNSDIVYDLLVHSRYMSHNSGNNMIFQQPGKYLITTGWRFGSGGDVWTGVRLLDIDGTVRGLGYGTGQVNGNDPAGIEITFIADIPASRVNQNMRMQFMRSGSTMAIATPANGFGYAIVTTVVQIGV